MNPKTAHVTSTTHQWVLSGKSEVITGLEHSDQTSFSKTESRKVSIERATTTTNNQVLEARRPTDRTSIRHQTNQAPAAKEASAPDHPDTTCRHSENTENENRKHKIRKNKKSKSPFLFIFPSFSFRLSLSNSINKNPKKLSSAVRLK